MPSSTASTAGAAGSESDSDGTRPVPLERRISQAFEEGHDADIPSNAGYVLDERGERRRRQSIASRRKSAVRSTASERDLEKGAPPPGGENGTGASSGGDKDDDGHVTEDEANVVWWDGPDDPENPYNWPQWKKSLNIALISSITLVAPLASSIFAPGVPQVMAEFESDSLALASFVVSVYVLGFATGPLLLAPMSEIYGRLPIYHVGNIGFVAFNVGCALAPSLNSLIVFRFLCGCFGSAPLTNGGGSIADMVEQSRRGAAMAGFTLGPLLGPIIGPIAGGFLADAAGWRWTFWLLVIAGGVLGVSMVVFARESYAPVLLERKTARLRKETGNELLRSRLDIGLSPADYFRRGIVRPVKLFIYSPIVAATAFYMAVVYSYLYLLFTTFTDVFERTYGFTTSTVGLSYLGLGVGSLVGLVVYSATSDRYVRKKMAEADPSGGGSSSKTAAAGDGNGGGGGGGVMKPEYRLPHLFLGSLLLPIGLFIYGWTAEYGVHWIVPIIGTSIVGFGNLMVFMSVQLYLVDAFTIYAASALASNTIVRSVAGAVLPLAGLPMYRALGLGWGNSLLGFIAVLLIPVAFLLIKYGEYLRNRFQIKNL